MNEGEQPKTYVIYTPHPFYINIKRTFLSIILIISYQKRQ